jgi:hypothetical protein
MHVCSFQKESKKGLAILFLENWHGRHPLSLGLAGEA